MLALLATIITDASARRLVAGESIREFAIYLRAVAAIYDPENDLAAAYGAAIRQQAALAEQLRIRREFQAAFARGLIGRGFQRDAAHPAYLLYKT